MYTNDKIYTTVRMTGGIKRFKMMYDGLLNKGYNVTLYCAEDKETLKKYNSKALSIDRTIEKKFIFSSLSIFFNNRKIIKKIKKDNYDCVIVFDVPTAIGLCISGIKNIYLFLRQDLIEYRKVLLKEKKKGKIYTQLYLKLMNFCEYVCCKRAAKIIVQCEYDLNNLILRHFFLKKKIASQSFIQINNTDAPWIVNKSKRTVQLKIEKDDKFCVAFIGDFSNNRKGHDLFLSSIAELINKNINIKAFVIGDGILLDDVKKKYRNFSNIKFLGRLDNPIDIIRQVDLIVVPSRADSCPNTVLESLYNRKLVIGANAGGIPEILNDKSMLFELNTKSLSNKIFELCENEEKYKKMLKKQEKRNKELCFDWIDRIISILEVDVND